MTIAANLTRSGACGHVVVKEELLSQGEMQGAKFTDRVPSWL